MKNLKILLPIVLLWCLTALGCAQSPAADKGPTVKERAEAKQKLGVSLIQEGDFQKGLGELLQAGELDPSNPEIQNAIGIAYHYLREFDRAILHLQRAIALKPDYADAQHNMGVVYGTMRRWEDALRFLNKAAGNYRYQNRHKTYEHIGTIYYHKGEFDTAVKNYTKALEINPKYAPAYENMGLAYERLESWNMAIRAYQRAIQLEPNYSRPQLYLGRLYFRLKRYDDAEKVLNEAINNDFTGVYAEESRRLIKEIEKARGATK